MPSTIWCDRAPYGVVEQAGEAVAKIEDTRWDTSHLFVFFDTVEMERATQQVGETSLSRAPISRLGETFYRETGEQVALRTSKISSVTPLPEGRLERL